MPRSKQGRKSRTVSRRMGAQFRWIRRYWFSRYRQLVRQTEIELGEDLHAC